MRYQFSRWFISIIPGILNTCQTRGGGGNLVPPNSLVFTLEALNLVCRVCLVLSFDFNFKICEVLMYGVTMTSFLCFIGEKA